MPLRKLDPHYNAYLIKRILSDSDNGIVISDEHNTIIAVNESFTEIMGYTPEEIIGKGGQFLRSGKHPESFYAEIWRKVQDEGKWEGELWVRRKSGEVFPEWLSLSTVKDEQGKIVYYLTIFSDITERKATADRIHTLMHDDPLTGLPNRNAFYSILTREIAMAAAHKKKLALITVSLHHFKTINDSFGYQVGDTVLQAVAERLKKMAPDISLVSRIAGDEFAFVLPGFTYPQAASPVTEQLLAAIRKPLVIEDHELVLDSYGGICIYPEDGDNAGALLKGAATAMNYAKKIGKGCYQYFNADIQNKEKARWVLENELRKGIEDHELVLYYQPVLNLKTGKIIGAEALVRWQHAGKIVSPGEFIPVAEQSGLVIPLTEWVVFEACRQMNAWAKMEMPPLLIGINITFMQFNQKDFLESLFKQISEVNMKGSRLKIEITEGVVMGDVARSIQMLREMKKRGLYISIDDFGTGYSSLSYLLQLPIDELKIDQSFVRDLDKKSESKEIVKAIISLAKSLKLSVLAEGIETKAQMDFLREQGCDEMQGFYFSKPLSVEEFTEMVKHGKGLGER